MCFLISSFSWRNATKATAARARCLAVLAAIAICVGGCATGDISMLATVAGGEKVRVPIDRTGVPPTKSDGFEIHPINFALDKEKSQLTYKFAFAETKHRTLKSVRVEDVSDLMPIPLMEDTTPVLAEGKWSGTARPISAGDAALKWIFNIENSLRVFRFTIVLNDGQSIVLHQGAFFPNIGKMGIRREFGEKY